MPTGKAFRGQSYAAIKKDCLLKGLLFEDPEFPAISKSLYSTKVAEGVEWLRPKELCADPHLEVDGLSALDLVTGDIDNSWFVTACLALTKDEKLWKQVVPDIKTQEWSEKNQYAGIFHFQFWRYGEWVDVVVDDRLPCRDGRLLFIHSSNKDEFWSALLEKAYAKMFGDYEALAFGHTSDALVDFTGGVSEKLDIPNTNLADPQVRKSFFNKMYIAIEENGLVNCHIRPMAHNVPLGRGAPPIATEKPDEPPEVGEDEVEDLQAPPPPPVQKDAWQSKAALRSMVGADGPEGLLLVQPYNVTKILNLEVKKSLQGAMGGAWIQMVRLYNPWRAPMVKEWSGAWSEGSAEWKKCNPAEFEKMGLVFKHGEFWMTFEDFTTYFTDVDICHFLNTSIFGSGRTWTMSTLTSEWSSSGRNGGNKFESVTFLSNPQFVFDITTDDPDTVVVSIEQRDVTTGRIAVGARTNSPGFYIMKVEENRKFRMHVQGELKFTSIFVKSRNVYGQVQLPKGRYVLVPCCAHTGASGEFMMRLFTDKNAKASELTREAPTPGCMSKWKMMTTLHVEMVDGLEMPEDMEGSLDPYLKIKCEGETVKTGYKKNTRSPKFDIKATFYRKKPAEPIIVEVWNHNTFVDDILCIARVDWPGTETGERKVFNFYGKGKEGEVVKPGNLHTIMRSSDDMMML